ncbi:MAG: pyruvate kinase, partial [Candidatus Eisenbacteria bacterium]|nr:pyruvate kinase [Candidatus Eisenbacteria bacterium]
QGGGRLPLPRGKKLRVAVRGPTSTPERLVIRFTRLPEILDEGDTILLDDGTLVLRVTGRSGRRSSGNGASAELDVVVVRGGSLKEHAGVNLPGRALRVRVPTRQDEGHARMAVAEQADFVALSFVQSPDELVRLRKMMQRWAGRKRVPSIVAKIEKPAALDNLDEILAVTDGVMVARGDLGVETALEKVPVWQKEILRRARRRGVFTITATQMLESMIDHATPTRAEVSDVANAVFDGTDALMLSAESAVGEHPVESVRMLSRIAQEVEHELPVRSPIDAFVTRKDRGGGAARPKSETPEREAIEAMVEATLALAVRSEAKCIACFTLTGRTGFLLSRHRSRIEVICLTPNESTRRLLTLAWNVRSLLLPRVRTADEMMKRGLKLLESARVVRPGDTVVLVGGAANVPEATNLLRWVRV